jgi:predicted ATPase/DNA-binding CsgD family transcriptional regulator
MRTVATLGVEALSAREAEVLDGLGQHLTNAQIATQLHISVRTVESHVSSLLRKLGAADRRELAGRAPELASRDNPVDLPGAWTTFIGRGAEIDEVVEAIAVNRLVTLTGPGGVGKTRLAVEVARRAAPEFTGGIAFVDLVPVNAEFVVQAVASALGVVERAQETLEQVVHQRLRTGRWLLVLDNCEHLLNVTAAFAQAVLGACQQTVVLATSRERLGVAGERILSVRPLAVTTEGESGSEAELLFLDRAGAVGGAEEAVSIGEICRRLDGMPLAIELAAARSTSLGLDGLLAGLDDHLRLLSRSSAADDRHGSIRTVIDWSHELLDDDERTLFRRLARFTGAFDLASAATVAGDGEVAATSDVIGRLTDKSLLVHSRDAHGSRWRMLETVHAYAREQLEQSGEEPDVRRRHLHWATATAREIEGSLAASPDWKSRFDAVADDLRAALGTEESGSGTRVGYDLALSLGHLTYARRFFVEARDHLEVALALAPDEASALVALEMTADIAFAEMRGELAFDLLQVAHERARTGGDTRAAAIMLARSCAIAGRCPALFVQPLGPDDLTALADRVRSLSMAIADDLEVSANVVVAEAWECRPGPLRPDPKIAAEAVVLARRLDDPVLISNALDAAGAAASSDGHMKESARLAAERLDLLERLPRHDPRAGGEIVDIFHMATEAALGAGDLPVALTSALASVEDEMSQGLRHFAANHLLIPLALQGAFDEALQQSEVMREGWERTGRPSAGWMAPAFFAAALVHGLRGDEGAYATWWDLATTIRPGKRNGFSLYVAPRVALHHGALEQATAASVADDEGTAGMFDAYARAMAVEVAVVTGAPAATDLLDAARPLAPENDFVAAQLLRAAGRLHGDGAELEESVIRWEGIGARFERACTLLLLPARAEEGAEEMAALGCRRPLV